MTRHQVETELSDIRREITRLQRREAQLLCRSPEDQAPPRPGWPMHRGQAAMLAQVSGAISSTSVPSRSAV